ncbi:SGNH hydrolase [Fusarium sp. NRRL 52700]|nr:SGNH hydrolase [Fusarium sp. NRRL 52700]
MRYFTLALFLIGSASASCWNPKAGEITCNPGKQGIYCNDYNTNPDTGGPIPPPGRTCQIMGSEWIGPGTGDYEYSYCPSTVVDLNGDRRSEYLWVDDNGAVKAFLNLGSSSGVANAAKIQWSAQGTSASGVVKNGTGVRFADLNGDGRAEYPLH